MEFRDLRADEIECRVAQCKENGLQLLLYKNARTDSTILDEAVGAENWQCKFYECKGNLFCSLGVNINYDKENAEPIWIWKDDCGSESNQDKEKGEASDAFKRSAFKYSIGKPLYSSPFIWIKPDKCKIYDTGRTDKYGNKIWGCKDKFRVKFIEYEEGQISRLLIANSTQHKDVYGLGLKLEDDIVITNGITMLQIDDILMNYPNAIINKGLNGKPLYSLTEDEGNKLIDWAKRQLQK